MPRTARKLEDGIPCHIVHRANAGTFIMANPEDKMAYLNAVLKYKLKHGVCFCAYCLMSNHVHFVALAAEAARISRFMHDVATSYAEYRNARYEKEGHVWGGRFYSVSMGAMHFRNALLYVERNPRRANIVSKPWLYPWSSAHAHVEGTDDPILDFVPREIENPTYWKNILEESDEEEFLKKIRAGTKTGKRIELVERTFAAAQSESRARIEVMN